MGRKGMDFLKKEWNLFYNLSFRFTKETRLQWLQTLLLHGILLFTTSDIGVCLFCLHDYVKMAVPFEFEKSKRDLVEIKCVLVIKDVMRGFWNYF